LPHWSIGKLINYKIETRNVFVINGGPRLRVSFTLSGLQRWQDAQILSQGVSTFSTGAASYRKADLQIFFLILQSAFHII